MNENTHDESDHPASELQPALRKDVEWLAITLIKTERVLSLDNISRESVEVVLNAIATVTAHMLQHTGPLAGALAIRLEKDAGIDALEALANGE